MNANELADKLANEWVLHDKNVGLLMKTSAEFLYTQITMFRQQQAEIEALKKEAALQRLSDFTQEATKTLTDDEIDSIAMSCEVGDRFNKAGDEIYTRDFARAILRKSQKK